MLVDDGPEFDPLAAPEPDTSLAVEDRPVGGLGIVLVRNVLDLAGEYISSAGLRVLLMAAKRLKEPPAALVLCGIVPGVRTVLELAGFLPLFVVEAGREQALARVARS
jgi:hypothetical protein